MGGWGCGVAFAVFESDFCCHSRDPSSNALLVSIITSTTSIYNYTYAVLYIITIIVDNI